MAGEGCTVGEDWREALTNPAVHDVGLYDGTFPAEVLRHRGAAHLQVLHLQGGPHCPRPLQLNIFSHEEGPRQAPFPPTAPSQGTPCGRLASRQMTAPSPPASTSPVVSQPAFETAQPLPHLTALLAEGAGPEDCLIETTKNEERENPAILSIAPSPELGAGGKRVSIGSA